MAIHRCPNRQAVFEILDYLQPSPSGLRDLRSLIAKASKRANRRVVLGRIRGTPRVSEPEDASRNRLKAQNTQSVVSGGPEKDGAYYGPYDVSALATQAVVPQVPSAWSRCETVRSIYHAGTHCRRTFCPSGLPCNSAASKGGEIAWRLGQAIDPVSAGMVPSRTPAFVSARVVCLPPGWDGSSYPMGRAARTRIEHSLLQKIPGYTLFRSMTRQMAGDSQENAWKPALVEIEDALVPAFIVEELDDGRFTVFVPSVPTPLAGAIYILTAARVHPVNVPFTQAIKAITRWGSGSKELVAAIQQSRQ